MGVILVAIIFAIFQSSKVEGLGLLEMISNYSKVVKNVEKPTSVPSTTESTTTTTTTTTQLSETATEPIIDYEDFDDLQEDRSLKQTSSTETMMKYFNGLVSLLALMYKFNGSFGGTKPSKHQVKNENEPRGKNIAKEVNKLHSTEKQLQLAQDRFEFPQKKFRHHDNINENMIDQQYQPVENYPPYNPLKANIAETYNQDDKKTSYDADMMQYDLTKNSLQDYSPDVDIQQSYSYEIPFENSKPVQTTTYDLTNDGTTWNNHNNRPVYHSWATNPVQDKPSNENSYQLWKTKPLAEGITANNEDSFNPWKSNTPDTKAPEAGTESRQPWNEKPLDFPIYHHDFKDNPSSDHHFEYHEIEHPMDEDRVSKKPYSYYFLGRKLWYIPLLFSVYFIIYIGALVLKSVARHKIQFPEKIWNLHDDHFGHGKHRRHRKIDDVTVNYEKAVEKMTNKFM